MQTKLITGNNITLISPTEMRVFLSLDSSVSDSELTTYIKSSTELFEKMTGHILMKKRYKTIMSLENYAFCDLPYTPILQIISCTSNGIAIPATDYSVIGGRFTLINAHRSSRVEITYDAGYETAVEVSEAMKNSVMQMVADFYFYKGSEEENIFKNHNLLNYKERIF